MDAIAAGAKAGAARPKPLAPDMFERVLALAAAGLLAMVIAAVIRGRDQWAQVPGEVWPHLLTIVIALALTPVMLLRRRGDRRHRSLDWIWVGSMIATALSSFALRHMNDGGFSVIHILSIWTLIQAPLIVVAARRHNVARHRSAVRGMVTGALLIAGAFTFPFGRLLGAWLFG